MAKIKIGVESPAILSAKRIAFKDIYIPKDLIKVLRLKFEPKTGHIQITGRAEGRATITGRLTTRSVTKSPRSEGTTSIEESKVKAKIK